MNTGERITVRQLTRLMITLVLATAILYLPAISLDDAGNGAWLSPVVDVLVGCIIVVMVYALHRQYPDKTLIQYLPLLFGRIVGRFLGLVYALFFLSSGLLVIRELVGLVHFVSLPQTPILVLYVVIFGSFIFMLNGGLEGIARAHDIIYLFFFALSMALFIGTIDAFHVHSLFPLLDKGWVGVLRGAYVPASWIGELVILAVLLPSVVREGSQLKILLMGTLLIGVMMVGIEVLIIITLGATEGGRTLFATYELVKYIQWGDFFQHLDSLFLVPWIAGMLLKATVLTYAGIFSLAQVLNIGEYRPLIVPVMVLSCVVTFWMFPDETRLREFLKFVFPTYALCLEFVLPLCLLVLHALKRHKSKRIVMHE